MLLYGKHRRVTWCQSPLGLSLGSLAVVQVKVLVGADGSFRNRDDAKGRFCDLGGKSIPAGVLATTGPVQSPVPAGATGRLPNPKRAAK